MPGGVPAPGPSPGCDVLAGTDVRGARGIVRRPGALTAGRDAGRGHDQHGAEAGEQDLVGRGGQRSVVAPVELAQEHTGALLEQRRAEEEGDIETDVTLARTTGATLDTVAIVVQRPRKRVGDPAALEFESTTENVSQELDAGAAFGRFSEYDLTSGRLGEFGALSVLGAALLVAAIGLPVLQAGEVRPLIAFALLVTSVLIAVAVSATVRSA